MKGQDSLIPRLSISHPLKGVLRPPEGVATRLGVLHPPEGVATRLGAGDHFEQNYHPQKSSTTLTLAYVSILIGELYTEFHKRPL